MGLSLPFIPKRFALEVQGALEPRENLIETELNAHLIKKSDNKEVMMIEE